MNPRLTEDLPLTVREAASEARCGTRTIRTAIRKGQLKAARINDRGDLRIYRSWLSAWIESRALPVSHTPEAA
jgi:excisionase family DNA binding protein